MEQRKKILKSARRIVVKVGSAVVAGTVGKGGDIFNSLAAEILRFRSSSDKHFVIVSSGAIALGMRRLGLKDRPASIPERQAVAAVGQGSLMSRYDAAFADRSAVAAQVLLTHDDLASRSRFLNARNTLDTLLKLGITPIINENDTVAVDEIKFGDNDRLAALVTNLVEADLLIILTNVDGLHDKNPEKHRDAKRVSIVEDIDSLDLAAFGTETNTAGTGGIISKCDSAKTAAHFGVPTIVTLGTTGEAVTKVLNGEDVGTLFLPKADRLTSKKHWIAFSTRPSGRVIVDDGAADALVKRGKSLLPTGVKDVDGVFEAGEVVHCVDAKGMEFARGVTNYSSAELQKIKGRKTTEVEAILGYKVYDEVIHRDNLVVM